MGMRSPAELSQMDELKLLMLEKERRRRKSKEDSQATREKVKEGAADFFTPPQLEHLAVAVSSGMTGGFLDEIAGKFPEVFGQS